MGIPLQIEAPTKRDQLRCEGQLLRGKFLDAFARLEGSVLDYVHRLELSLPSNAPFIQRLNALKKAREQFKHPKKLDERHAELVEINAIRADIVHAVLEAVQIWDGTDETNLLQFRNVGNPSAVARQLSCEELAKLASRVGVLAHQFSQQQLKAPAPAAPASTSE